MSKGNRILRVRVEPDLLRRIELQIAQRNVYTKGEPWTVSDFIRKAMAEKLAHMERARGPRGRKAGRAPASTEDLEAVANGQPEPDQDNPGTLIV